ncbi:MAG: SPASM domain-containing protein [Deltaproteobacteria bacterium]|nr:SPASM domain-containing protein [Deltaproteobacteria bacterium]
MCAINEDPRLQKGGEWYGDMDMRVFKNIEPYLSNIFRVDINGHGEALLNRAFLQILEDVKKRVPFVGLTSNALLINEEVGETMVRCRMNELIISIHSAESGLYNEISRPGKLETLLENIETINRYKRKYNSDLPVLKFQFVGMRKNVSQLEGLLKLAAGMNVSELTVLPLAEYSAVRGESLGHYPELVRQYFPPAIRLAERLGIRLNIPHVYMNILAETDGSSVTRGHSTGILFEKRSPRNVMVRDCLDPWIFCFVMQSGRIRPCCVIEENMGSLFNQTFEDIWFGEKYKTLRARILSNDPPKECTTCINRPMTSLANLRLKLMALGLVRRSFGMRGFILLRTIAKFLGYGG